MNIFYVFQTIIDIFSTDPAPLGNQHDVAQLCSTKTFFKYKGDVFYQFKSCRPKPYNLKPVTG